MKNCGALKQVYRHQFYCHGEAFCAIAVAAQLSIKGGKPLFSCVCYDAPYHINNDAIEDISSGIEFLSDITGGVQTYGTDSKLQIMVIKIDYRE